MNLSFEWFLIPVGMGGLLLAVVAYLKHKSHQLKQRIQSLYEINQDVNQDALDFIHQAWSSLNQSGCEGLVARVDWFGELTEMRFGQTKGAATDTQRIIQSDIHIELLFYAQALRGEKRYMAQLIQQTFIQLLAQDVYIKLNQILLTQQRLERFQLFAQHDLKNLMQFIELLGDQVERIKTAEEYEKLVNRLKASLPSLKQRARRTLGQLKTTLTGDTDMAFVSVQDMIQIQAKSLLLDVQFEEEDASVWLSAPSFKEVLVNVLTNFRDHGEKHQPLCVKIYTKTAQVAIDIYQIADSAKQDYLRHSAMRLFEPFWTSSQSGMGLGLFLSRELLAKMGGSIRLINENQQVGFKIVLPINQAQVAD